MADTTAEGTTDQAAAARERAAARAANAAEQLDDTQHDSGLGFLDFVKEPEPAAGAEQTTDTPTVETTTEADGTKIETSTTVDAAGKKTVTKIATRADGSKTTTAPDGTVTAVDAAGKPVEVKKAALPAAEPAAAAAADDAWSRHPKTVELERRVKEVRNYSTQVNQKLAELEKQNQKLQAQVDGTYDPDLETAAEPTREDIERKANDLAKVRASVHLAARELGSLEAVNAKIFNEDAPFRRYDDRSWIQDRVMASEAPALEALQVLREEEFFERYGTRDPVKIVEKLTAELRPQIEKDVRAAVEAEMRDRLAAHERQIPSVGLGRASDTGTSPARDRDDREVPLSEMGNPGLS